MNKNYFNYIIQSKKIGWIFFAIMYISISLFSALFVDSYDWINTVFDVSLIFGFALTIVLPILLFHYVHSKKSVDMYFSLPISRRQMLVTSIVFQFLYIFGLFFVTTLIGVIFTHEFINISNYVLMLMHVAVSYLVLILFYSALYLVANNNLDGIVVIGAYSLAPILIYISFDILGNALTAGSLDWNAVRNISLCASPIALSFYNASTAIDSTIGLGYSFNINDQYEILLLVYGIISTILVYRHFVKRKAERAEQISNEIMSYPIIIHFYLILVLLTMSIMVVQDSITEYFIFWLILLLIYVIAMFVYMRKITVNLRIITRYIILTIATIAISLIGWNTKGFGMAYHRSIPSKGNIVYAYSAYVDGENLQDVNVDYDETNVQIDFHVYIPVDQMDEYQEVYEILEKYRRQYVDAYYENPNEYYSNATVYRTYDEVGAGYKAKQSNMHTYNQEIVISLEDLKVISTYADVLVSKYDEDGVSRFYELDEYLESIQS